MDKQNISQDLVRILSKAIENRIYGSVEIFFEDGNITQITQRIINKVKSAKADEKVPSKNKKDIKVSKNKVSESGEVINNSSIIN